MKIIPSIFLSLIFVFSAARPGSDPADSEKSIALAAFKSRTCRCCGRWIAHLERLGFNPVIRDKKNLDTIKNKFNIPTKLQSCHFDVSAESFVYENPIRTKFIQGSLSSPPDGAIGLAVPSMPAGSPDMELAGRFSPYSVILKSDGSQEVFADVSSAKEQFDVQ